MSALKDLDPWYLDNLVCPVDGSALSISGEFLHSAAGRRYPVVDGVPVMLRADVANTIDCARASLEDANSVAEGGDRPDPLFVRSLGITDEERSRALELHREGSSYDPVIAVMVGATSGIAYAHLRGRKVAEYPIPELRFPTPKSGLFLDIGCNWGRWALAAARQGHDAIGIDPQLGSVLAAKRLAASLGSNARFVVGDARYLPFRGDLFDYAWSYSVLQHFSQSDAETALAEIGRVLCSGGMARVQMANRHGIRSFYHMARRGFAEPEDFEVRYWHTRELIAAFERTIGDATIKADCYFGLGLQRSDYSLMTPIGKAAILASEAMVSASKIIPALALGADSLFLDARKPISGATNGDSTKGAR